jgi:hypothetical protein
MVLGSDGSVRTSFVPDSIRMGVAPVNRGINNELGTQVPLQVSSAEIRKNIKLTLGGQYSKRMPAQVGSISELPHTRLFPRIIFV